MVEKLLVLKQKMYHHYQYWALTDTVYATESAKVQKQVASNVDAASESSENHHGESAPDHDKFQL